MDVGKNAGRSRMCRWSFPSAWWSDRRMNNVLQSPILGRQLPKGTVLSTHATHRHHQPVLRLTFLKAVGFWLRFRHALRWRRYGDDLSRVVAPHPSVCPSGTQPLRRSSTRGNRVHPSRLCCIVLFRASASCGYSHFRTKVSKRLTVGKDQTLRGDVHSPEGLTGSRNLRFVIFCVNYFIFLFLHVHWLPILYIFEKRRRSCRSSLCLQD